MSKIKIDGKEYDYNKKTDMITGYKEEPVRLALLLKFNPYARVDSNKIGDTNQEQT